MACYRLTSKAEEDLLDSWSALAEQRKVGATKLIRSFHQPFPLLAEQAQLGQARPDIRADVRCFPVKRDLILSRRRSDGIKVVRVVHGSSDLGALFETGDSDESPATPPPSLVRDSISGDDGWLHTKKQRLARITAHQGLLC